MQILYVCVAARMRLDARLSKQEWHVKPKIHASWLRILCKEKTPTYPTFTWCLGEALWHILKYTLKHRAFYAGMPNDLQSRLFITLDFFQSARGGD